MAQIVYYFYSGLAVGSPHRPVAFSVPTGNFGDIFAGYLAKQMGLPIEQLIVATNANDILHRCISANDHSKQDLIHSLSPSMDIMVSSNFERLLFDLYGRDGKAIQQLIEDFKSGEMPLNDTALIKMRELFSSYRLDDEEMIAVITDVFESTEYLLDPHTAIGVQAARKVRKRQDIPMICLATAHPAKFPEAVRKAGQTQDPALPHHMQDLFEREERFTVLPEDINSVQKFIQENTRV
jgi:threonine synthase